MTRLDKKIRRLAVYRSPFDIATDLGISESVVFSVLKYGQVEKRAAVSLAAIKADYVPTHISTRGRDLKVVILLVMLLHRIDRTMCAGTAPGNRQSYRVVEIQEVRSRETKDVCRSPYIMIAVSRRAWLVFAAIQTIGCVLASYGTVYSESAFVRGSWLIGFLLLLPGNLSAMAVGQTLIHVRTAYIFFPVAVACNAMLWVMCSTLWRTLRRTTPKSAPHTYTIALAATGLVLVIANTIHFLRPHWCWDCFFPYGLPFTLYHDGGYGGGAGFVWGGLAADIGCVVGVALLVGRAWELIARQRVSG